MYNVVAPLDHLLVLVPEIESLLGDRHEALALELRRVSDGVLVDGVVEGIVHTLSNVLGAEEVVLVLHHVLLGVEGVVFNCLRVLAVEDVVLVLHHALGAERRAHPLPRSLR